MKLPRATVLGLLVTSVLVSFVLRYPGTDHETGVDSFFIHNLTTSIVRDGNARWILNPLSLFGLYPLSYPSAGPMVLASLSGISGLGVESTILLTSFLSGGFGILAAFVLAREFRDDDLFCISVSFLYGFAPRFLSFTLWTASTRGLFMVLLPVLVLMILRAYRDPRAKNFSLLILTFGILAAVHRLGILMAVVVLGSIIAVVIALVLRIFRMRAPEIFLRSSYRRLSSYLALAAIIAVSGTMIFGTNVLGSYAEGQLATGASLEVEMFNLGVSLARSVGLALLFSVLGLFIIVRFRNRTLREPFLVVAFLALIPTLFLRVYTGFYILPFIALLGGLTLLAMSQAEPRRLFRPLLVLSIASAFVFSSAVLQYEERTASAMPDSTYSTAVYVSSMQRPGLIANDGLLGVRVAAFCGCPYLPVGGAGTTFQSPELLADRFFTPEEVAQNLTRIPLSELTLESDSPWIVDSIQAEGDWVGIMQNPYNEHSSALGRYQPTLLLENVSLGANFLAYGNVYPSDYVSSASANAYVVYSSPRESLYYVLLP